MTDNTTVEMSGNQENTGSPAIKENESELIVSGSGLKVSSKGEIYSKLGICYSNSSSLINNKNNKYFNEEFNKTQIVLHHTVSGPNIDGDVDSWLENKYNGIFSHVLYLYHNCFYTI